MLLGVLRETEQPFLLEVVADEVRLVVDDELPRQRLGALVGHARRLRLGGGHVEQAPEHLVHGEKSRGHAGARREEPAPAHAVTRAQGLGELLHPRLDTLLVRCLGQRVELTVRNDLRRNR